MTSNPPADTPTDAVIIERTVAAPPELVWRMWTEAAQFATWYGPAGATIATSELDLRVGGRRFVQMQMDTPNGPMEMFFTGEVREIVANERFVYTEAMADADGNELPASAMGMPEGHPMTTEVTVELRPADGGGTQMVMTHAGIPADSPGAMGWGMALDKLEAALAG